MDEIREYSNELCRSDLFVMDKIGEYSIELQGSDLFVAIIIIVMGS